MIEPQETTKKLVDFPLHFAAAEGNIDTVFSLLKTINPNVKDNYQLTPMHWAAKRGQIAIMELLLSYGASINALNQNDNTPLHSAAYGNQPEAITWLLQNNAQISSQNKNGDTPLHSAAWKGNVKAIHALGSTDLNTPNHEGDTPSHLAAWNNRPASIEALLSYQADMTIRNADEKTPEDLAKEKNHHLVLEVLNLEKFTETVMSFQ